MSLIAEIHKDLEQGAIRLIAESRDCLMAEAMRLCGDLGSAEDLLMRTFSKAIKNIDQHKVDESLLAWMKAIMRNLHLNDTRNIQYFVGNWSSDYLAVAGGGSGGGRIDRSDLRSRTTGDGGSERDRRAGASDDPERG